MKKGQVIQDVLVESISSEGKGVGRVNGQVIFLKNVVPGDRVAVKVSGKKKKFLEGYPIEFKTYSKERIDPFCSHFGICGGCKWQNLSYESQLHYKQQKSH